MQKYTKPLLIGLPALLILIMIVFFNPITSLFRSDLGPDSQTPGPSGLYLQNTTVPLQAGSGATLSSTLELNQRGELPVLLSLSLGDTSKKYTLSGTLSYDPNALSLSKDNIATASGYLMDSFLMQVSRDEKGHETGTVMFSFEAEKISTPAHVGTFFFTPQTKNIKSSIWLQTIAITDTSAKNKKNILSLSRTHPIATLISKALHIETSGVENTWQTFTKEGSGTVIQNLRQLPSGNIITKKSWKIATEQAGNEEEHVSEETLSKEGKRLSFTHYTFSKTGQKKEVESSTGSIIKTTTDSLDRIQSTATSGTGNTVHSTMYYYSMQKITTDEWWKQDSLPQKHMITYPNRDTMSAEFIYEGEHFQVKNTFSSAKGSTVFLWKRTPTGVETQTGTSAQPLRNDSLAKDLQNCRIFVPQNASLESASLQFTDSAEDTTAQVQNVCKIQAFLPNEAYEVKEFFIPLTLKFTIANPGNYTPVFLNTSTGEWEELEPWQKLSQDNLSMKVLFLKGGQYGLKNTPK